MQKTIMFSVVFLCAIIDVSGRLSKSLKLKNLKNSVEKK